jgi:Zn-dependent peptidase ImmA (M78 family)/DNA-binding XRE family transcriptional regulator
MDEPRRRVAENIARAREEAKITQAEAAKRLGVDRPRLIGMEKGERPVDAAMLVALAELYRVTVTQLVQGLQERPSTPVLFRGCLDGVTPEEQQAVDHFQRFCQTYALLLQKTGSPVQGPQLLPSRPSSSSRTRHFAVEGDAAQLRRLWNIDEAAPIGEHLFVYLEEQGVVVYRSAVASDQLAGASVLFPDLGPAMLVNTTDTPQRQVFTAAHELAHVLYHLGRDADNCCISRKLDRSSDEQLANEFASAFLMPESGIKQFLARHAPRDEQLGLEDVIALQRHFRVSYAAMLYRLKKLGVLRGGAHFDGLKAAQPVKEAQRLGYPVQAWERAYRPTLERPGGLPEAFVGLVLRTYQDGQLGRSRAAQALEMDVEGFQAYLVQLTDNLHMQALDAEFEDAAASVG